jgi:diaminohydroxyphosphoribosylaminopyrimidine deaminase/5-amino-6-(5-phosphoribosylamino)uracil reductase
MQRAIRLSKRGLPAPNPHVGCVITQADRMVGEGYHHYAGARHAEVEALAAAGSEAAGSTVYVTLEPCNHFGRTPPCAEALIAANVGRVVVACLDPNPVASGGIARLRGAGIAVETGLMAEEAYVANEQFHVAMRLRRPCVTLKAAISLDGRIALPSGESKWLTSPDARARGRRLRAECGSVLVGRRTVEADDPALTARISGVVNQPLRVVLDPSAKLDSHWKVFDSSGPSLHVVDGTLGLRAGPMGFDPADLCAALFEQGVTGLLVEGGASTASRFIQTGLVDRIELFVAPKLLGSGPSWLEGLIVHRLADAPLFKIVSLKKLKVDVQISLRAERGNFSRVDTDIAE